MVLQHSHGIYIVITDTKLNLAEEVQLLIHRLGMLDAVLVC